MAETQRRALVTGAGRRVGRAIAEELARAGCAVAVHCLSSASAAAEVVASIRAGGGTALLVTGDLAEPGTADRIVAEVLAGLGGLEILVNNAAVFPADPPGGFDWDHWQRTLAVNVCGPTALALAVRDLLAADGRGKIVNLVDIAADRPWPGHLAYCASKAALASVTRGLARALAPDVQVNGLAPGIAEFPEDYDPQIRHKLIRRVPLGRAGTPADIARAVRFLVESGDYITGQILNIDGGRSIV